MRAVIAALILIVTPSLATAQERATIYVDAADVRKARSMSDPVIATLTKGAIVVVQARSGVWARITSGKTKRWVRASTFTLNPGTGGAGSGDAAKPASTPTKPSVSSSTPTLSLPKPDAAVSVPSVTPPSPSSRPAPSTTGGSAPRWESDPTAARGLSIGG